MTQRFEVLCLVVTSADINAYNSNFAEILQTMSSMWVTLINVEVCALKWLSLLLRENCILQLDNVAKETLRKIASIQIIIPEKPQTYKG